MWCVKHFTQQAITKCENQDLRVCSYLFAFFVYFFFSFSSYGSCYARNTSNCIPPTKQHNAQTYHRNSSVFFPMFYSSRPVQNKWFGPSEHGFWLDSVDPCFYIMHFQTVYQQSSSVIEVANHTFQSSFWLFECWIIYYIFSNRRWQLHDNLLNSSAGQHLLNSGHIVTQYNLVLDMSNHVKFSIFDALTYITSRIFNSLKASINGKQLRSWKSPNNYVKCLVW